jgi:hypothetical protein
MEGSVMKAHVKGAQEDEGARRWNGSSFGERGSSWATVLDISLCDIEGRSAHRRVNALRKIALCVAVLTAPVIDLNIKLLVRSPSFTEVPAYFVSPVNGERSLVRDAWDPAAVVSWVTETVDAVGPATGEHVIATLQRNFWVDDPNEDQWMDVPLEDEGE